MNFNYLALIVGGVGPDVWEKEENISAADFMDAAGQAQAKADELGGQVVMLEQNDAVFEQTKDKVFLLTTGSGQDGDEWNVESIHATPVGVAHAKQKYERPRSREDGSTYSLTASIEEWKLEE